jgi:hypothetical protein
MSLHDFAEYVRHLSLFTAVRESKLVYPCILSTHLAIIGVFGGLIVVTNMRLFGLVLTRYSIASVIRELRPYKWLGLILMVTMGILLMGSKANIYYDNPYFIMKMSLLFLIIPLHSLIFHKSVYQDETVPAADGTKTTGIAKIAGLTSLVLWVSIVICGRWIAYYDRPDEQKLQPDGAGRMTLPASPPAAIADIYVAKVS